MKAISEIFANIDGWLYANNKIGKRWLASRERRKGHKRESEKGNEHRQRWSMRFSHVNGNDFTLNTYFEHTEKQVCERTKEKRKD